MQSYMLRDEEFCMQVSYRNRIDARDFDGSIVQLCSSTVFVLHRQTDSHMDVVPTWDEAMMQMWGRANNEYGVLTTYVHVQESIHDLNDAMDKTKQVRRIRRDGCADILRARYIC